MSKKGNVFLIILVSSLALIFSSCQTKVVDKSLSSNTKAKDSISNIKDNIIKVGWIGDLSGRGAPTGEIELNVIRMLFDEINLKGGILGKKLEVIGYDAKSNVQEAVKGTRNLIDREKVIAIIGPNTSKSAIPISKVLAEKKIPGIVTSATNPEITKLQSGKVNPFTFRICMTDMYQGEMASKFVKETLDFSKAAILFDETDEYSKGLANYFEGNFNKLKGEIVSKQAFKAGDIDFTKQLKKIKAKKPEVLYLPDFYYDVYYIAEQAAKLGLKARFVGGDAWCDANIPEKLSKYLEKSFYVTHIDFDSPETIAFKNDYLKIYGEIINSANPYLVNDVVMTLIEAIKRAGSLENIKIIKALEKTNIYGTTGQIIIDPTTHNPKGKEAVVMRIINGKFVFYQRLSAEK